MSNRKRILVAVAILALIGAVLAVVIPVARWVPPTRPPLPPQAMPDQERPNVVLVIVCTLRADQLTAYNPEYSTTPFLADLAATGARFDDALTQAPWTRPGSTAILTGHHPAEVGIVETRPGRNERSLADEAVVLSERLYEAGYTTIGATANPNLDPIFGFDQGFVSYDSLSGLWREGFRKVHGDKVVRTALQRVSWYQEAGRPVYLQLLMVDPHQPYAFRDSELAPYIDQGFTHRMARYHASLHRLEEHLQDLLAGLERRGITEDNTIFMVVNDHGEGLDTPEHHGRGHGRYLYPSVVKMVWLARGPGIAEGHVVKGLAGQIDVVPSILGLVGLPADPSLPGLDHTAILGGEAGRIDREQIYVDTRFTDVDRAAVYTDEVACMNDFGTGRSAKKEKRTGLPKFHAGCYDRENDPLFEDPYYNAHLMGDLTAWRTGLEERREAWEEVVGTGEREVGDDLPDEIGDQLEALGYTD